MTEQHKDESGQVRGNLEPLLDRVLASAQTDIIGELGARRHNLNSAARHRYWGVSAPTFAKPRWI